MSATVAVVGRGFGAAVHAPGWRLAGANVLGPVGRDAWRDVVAQADVVSVATPPAAHAEVVLEAARRGARILCEKPLAATLADAEAIEAAARTLPTTVNFSYRAIPAFVRFRELLDAPELDVVWTTGSRLSRGAANWRDDPTQGGALAAYGVHALDYARWLLGDAHVVRATLEPNGDAFTAALEHAGGGRTTISVSLVADERVHRLRAGELVLENLDRSDPVGAFVLRRNGSDVAVSGQLPRTLEAGDPRVGPFAVHARALLEDADRPTFTDGLQAQRLLDEVRRAAS